MRCRLSTHSPRDRRSRVTCASSWQIWHFCAVNVAPGPEVSFSGSCACAAGRLAAMASAAQASLRPNRHSNSMHAVPEVSERIPRRLHRLRIAAVVPRAREERLVAEALRLKVERKRAPCEPIAGRPEPRLLPGAAFIARDFDAVDRSLANPGAAAHDDA